MRDVELGTVLAELGYEGEVTEEALAALQRAGLTRPGKVRIAARKLPEVAQVLRAAFLRVCTRTACQQAAAGLAAGRRQVAVARPFCDVCGGSDNRRAVEAMAEAMWRTGKLRLLVLGGTPAVQQELVALLPPPCEVRFVLHDTRRTAKEAAQEGTWADLVVIWASTPIPHKVTGLYKGFGHLTVARRGIAALAEEVTRALQDG